MENIKESKLVEDIKFVKFVIDRTIPFPKMLEQIDEEGTYDHNIFCP